MVKKSLPESMDVALLVNNAAVPGAGPIDMKDGSAIQKEVDVNCLAPVYMTKALLPRLKARQERSGVIVVSSSMAAFTNPGFTMYSMAKIFVSYFAMGLNFELAQEGTKIDVLDYRPSFITTKFSGATTSNPTALTPDGAAAHSLDDLGRTTTSTGSFSHDIMEQLQVFGAAWLPTILSKIMYKEAKAKMLKDREAEAK